MALPLLGIALRVGVGAARAGARAGAGSQGIAFSVESTMTSASILAFVAGNVRSDVNSIGNRLTDTLKADTPKDTGRARRGWKRKNTASGFQITNRVDHIGALNEGSSSQAPRNYVGRSIRSTQIK